MAPWWRADYIVQGVWYCILLVIFGPKSEPGEQQQKMPTRFMSTARTTPLARHQHGWQSSKINETYRRSATIFATLGVRPQREATGSRLRQSESDGPARMSVSYWLNIMIHE
jgi:hypothetical protein